MSDAAQYLGLSKKGAQNQAEKENKIFRLIRVDAKEMFSYPTDQRTDRVCIEIDNGKVTKATVQ